MAAVERRYSSGQAASGEYSGSYGVTSAGTSSGGGRKIPDQGLLRSQRMLLTWLTEYPGFYPVLKEYVSPEDFEEGFYREAATMLYEQLETGEAVPAKIVSHFSDPEEQKLAALLFNTSEPGLNEEELKKAMRETIRKVVDENSRRQLKANDTDVAALREMIARKKKLENLNKLEIQL